MKTGEIDLLGKVGSFGAECGFGKDFDFERILFFCDIGTGELGRDYGHVGYVYLVHFG